MEESYFLHLSIIFRVYHEISEHVREDYNVSSGCFAFGRNGKISGVLCGIQVAGKICGIGVRLAKSNRQDRTSRIWLPGLYLSVD
ncbi:hypothetical protein [Citrobacter braakii]|uniref:hypothetical protein n=1 Tax=Citrobacter braakii TaxID=57706 RepID=UPI001C4FCAD4|nr:hypothetical protein [Citrobacter braakii]